MRRRISRVKYTILFKSFIADIPSNKAEIIAGVNRKTADKYYNLFRQVKVKEAIKESEKVKLGNGIEIDKDYFESQRIRGKRGRGANKKIIALGLLKRGSNIYIQIIKNVQKIGDYVYNKKGS